MSETRLRAAILALSALGAGIAAYITFAHYAHTPVACLTGGCETVQTSHWSELGGVPVAALGLAAYLVLAVSALSRSDLARAVGAATAAGGFVFALFLVYVQAAEIGAFCQWCLGSDAVLALLVPATLVRAARADPRPAGPSPRAPRRSARAPGRSAARARPRRSTG